MEAPIVLTACILLVFFSASGQCCGPAEIGHQYIITSIASVPFNAWVQWQLNQATLLTANKYGHIVNNQYLNIYTGSKTQLAIFNVTLKNDKNVFQHNVNGGFAYTCQLSVYKRANPPTCENVTFNGNQLRTTCTTAEVYPQAKCQFVLDNKVTNQTIIIDDTPYIRYSHTQPQGNEYYSTSCTLQYPLDRLKPGNWTVQVTMYPDLEGLSLTEGTTGQIDMYLLPNLLTDQAEKKDSLPLAAIAGGAVGAVVVIAVVVVVGVIIYIRRGHIGNSDPYNAYAFKDNSELDGNAAARGYNPYQDPTAVFTDNSELYATASKGYNPHQDPTAVFIDNSELYATASKGYNPHQDPTAVFTDNSELYATASKGYNPHEDPTAVFTDNSELYATTSKEPSLSMTARNDNLEPTMTSAKALSETYTPETGLNPYDDIDQEKQKREQELFGTKSKTQPTTETPVGPPQYSVSNEDEVDLDAHTWI